MSITLAHSVNNLFAFVISSLFVVAVFTAFDGVERVSQMVTSQSAYADSVAASSPPARPHDPWVFRCVLDGRPRMLVVALRQDLWLAYDGTTCGISKVMSQPPNFEGAVFTGGHGPQPTSNPPHHEAHAPEATGWTVADADGNPRALRLLGYRLDGQRSITLRYGLSVNQGDGSIPDFTIDETPQLCEDNSQGWQRDFHVQGLPEGWTLIQHLGESNHKRNILSGDPRNDVSHLIEADRFNSTPFNHYALVTFYASPKDKASP